MGMMLIVDDVVVVVVVVDVDFAVVYIDWEVG